MKKTIHRRTFLKGLGASLTLPFLESAAPFTAQAVTAKSAGTAPLRMAFVYFPNGAIMPSWTPDQAGRDFELPPTLQPLKNVQKHVQILSGLDHEKAKANGDGGGDHARANATFLTGCQARKTAGSDIRIGISVDQIAAQQIGNLTKLPSLELSCDQARSAGRCDSGYSCAYQFNLSWRSENMPMPPESNPRLVFERLFGESGSRESKAAQIRRIRQRRSILDFVREDAKSLQQNMAAKDRQKLEEYFTSVREIEQRIDKAEQTVALKPDYDTPSGIPGTYKDHIRTLYDMMALGFQSDVTRISTFLLAHDGSNRSFRNIGVPEGHHQLSHHQKHQDKIDKLQKIDQFYVEQFAYFIEKLKSIKEDDGTLLDHTMIVYGGGISDANRHSHEELPVILAGGGNQSLQAGRHVRFNGAVPLTNLYLSMLDRMGVPAERIGDSTGRLKNI